MSFRIRAVALIAACEALTAAAAPGSTSISAQQVMSQIRHEGGKEVLARVYDTPIWTGSIAPGLASGELAWLRVGEALGPFADGAAGEDLDAAMLGSIANAPFKVLPELSRIYGEPVEQLCDLSFESEVPARGVTNYLQGIRAKLDAAKSRRDLALAKDCRSGLDESASAAAAQGLK